MELYFSPMACSIATRIALYEISRGEQTTFHQVSLSSKQLADGSDYRAVNPKGQVPALRTDDGQMLTEGPAIVQYVADLAPDSGLAPRPGTFARYRLQERLNFLSSELHKAILHVSFSPSAPVEAKTYAKTDVAPQKLAILSNDIGDRPYLQDDHFTVADAYAFFVLELCGFAGVSLEPWSALKAYHGRLSQRPSIARAVSEERPLLMARLASKAVPGPSAKSI